MPHARHLAPTSPLTISSRRLQRAGWRKEKRRIEETQEEFLNDVFDQMTGHENGPIRIYGLENVAWRQDRHRALVGWVMLRRRNPLFVFRSTARIQKASAIRHGRPRSGCKKSTGRTHAHVSDSVESERDLTSDELSRQFAFSF